MNKMNTLYIQTSPAQRIDVAVDMERCPHQVTNTPDGGEKKYFFTPLNINSNRDKLLLLYRDKLLHNDSNRNNTLNKTLNDKKQGFAHQTHPLIHFSTSRDKQIEDQEFRTA